MSVQSMEALINANRVRMARAALKRDIASGVLTVADVLADVPEHCGSIPVSMLLAAQDRWGKVRAERLLRSAGVPYTMSVVGLTDRQRRALLLRVP